MLFCVCVCLSCVCEWIAFLIKRPLGPESSSRHDECPAGEAPYSHDIAFFPPLFRGEMLFPWDKSGRKAIIQYPLRFKLHYFCGIPFKRRQNAPLSIIKAECGIFLNFIWQMLIRNKHQQYIQCYATSVLLIYACIYIRKQDLSISNNNRLTRYTMEKVHALYSQNEKVGRQIFFVFIPLKINYWSLI